MLQRDYEYESNLRGNAEYDWGMGEYPKYTFAIPLEVGLDFWISNRVLFRVGTSYHFVFTDLIDHVSSENTPNNRDTKRIISGIHTAPCISTCFSEQEDLAVQAEYLADNRTGPHPDRDDDNDGYYWLGSMP
jgi:hypothetical protein